MKKFVPLLFIIFFFPFSHSYSQTNISGIVNLYTRITKIDTNECEDTIWTTGLNGFKVGDTVLIIQIQGANINFSNTSSFGEVTNYDNTGNYEINFIAKTFGNGLLLKHRLIKYYDTHDSARVQLVKIPYYNSANVVGTITCPAWNGTTGGIIAISAGDLTLNNNIDATGKGFRKGQGTASPIELRTKYFYSKPDSGCYKGEGIHIMPLSYIFGKGKNSNGGGGANCVENGGGGGGNVGKGGNGAHSYFYPSYYSIGMRGIGGAALDYTNPSNKIFMGGGGGGGNARYAANASIAPGAPGGGIVIIIANNLNGNGYSIKANGADAINRPRGTGGGGAGGVMLLNVNSFNPSGVNLEAKGGKGGDSHLAGSVKYGPGGGGGGGAICFTSSSLPSGVTIDVSGGLPGISYMTPPPILDNEPGDPGDTLFNVSIAQGTVALLPPIILGPDIHLCQPGTVTLDAGPGYTNYLWSTGETTQSINVTTSGTYWVKGTSTLFASCYSLDTIIVGFHTPPTAYAGKDSMICYGQSIQLTASLGDNYLWSNGNTTNTITVTPSVTTTYTVTVSDIWGCGTTDDVVVFVDKVNVNIGDDDTICRGQSKIIASSVSGGIPPYTYAWSGGGGTNSSITITPLTNVSYKITVTDSYGCKGTDLIIVRVSNPTVNAGTDKSICIQDSTTLAATVSGGYAPISYLWSPGSYTSNSIKVSPPTTTSYTVQITDNVGCTKTDGVLVNVSNPITNISNDTIICYGNNVNLKISVSGGSPPYNYSWSPGNYTTATINVTPLNDTKYFVTITDSYNCKAYDSVQVNISHIITNAGQDDTICIGGSTTLTGNGFGGYTPYSYSWSPGGYNNPSIIVSPSTTTTYTFNLTDSVGCTVSDNVIV
ncbi:MAG TPA: hypothetical protein P5250_04640, partial [Bacteroidales bacterium]|nr:hypothetical protein [Bacteroidales bacterium]